MKYSPALEKAFGNLDAITTKAFRKRTMGLDADEPEIGSDSADDEKTGAMPEGVDQASPEGALGNMGGAETSDKALDESSLKRIIEALKNRTA